MVKCGKGEGTHVPAQRAGKFFFRGTGLPTAVRKNQPLVPRSNLGGKVCARTNPWFRGQTLLVLGHGGGGYMCVWYPAQDSPSNGLRPTALPTSVQAAAQGPPVLGPALAPHIDIVKWVTSIRWGIPGRVPSVERRVPAPFLPPFLAQNGTVWRKLRREWIQNGPEHQPPKSFRIAFGQTFCLVFGPFSVPTGPCHGLGGMCGLNRVTTGANRAGSTCPGTSNGVCTTL